MLDRLDVEIEVVLSVEACLQTSGCAIHLRDGLSTMKRCFAANSVAFQRHLNIVAAVHEHRVHWVVVMSSCLLIVSSMLDSPPCLHV